MDLLRAADDAVNRRDLVSAERLLSEALSLGQRPAETAMRLAGIRRATGDLHGAIAAVTAALVQSPRDPTALLLKGTLLEAVGQDPDEPYRAALHFFGDDTALPGPIRERLAHARALCARARAARVLNLTRIAETALADTDATPHERDRIASFAEQLADGEPVVFAELDHRSFHAVADFPGVAEMAAAHQSIRSEYLGLMAARLAADTPYINHPDGAPLDQWAALNRSSAWSAVHLLRGGHLDDALAARCAVTMARYREVAAPVIAERGPNLMFSILQPGTRIPPHTGVCNARLVLHVPLIIPPDCAIRVGSETRTWTPGEALVFDDTVEHEAWNDSAEVRVVLIGDLWHPGLSTVERSAMAALLAFSGQGSAAAHQAQH